MALGLFLHVRGEIAALSLNIHSVLFDVAVVPCLVEIASIDLRFGPSALIKRAEALDFHHGVNLTESLRHILLVGHLDHVVLRLV